MTSNTVYQVTIALAISLQIISLQLTQYNHGKTDKDIIDLIAQQQKTIQEIIKFDTENMRKQTTFDSTQVVSAQIQAKINDAVLKYMQNR